MNKISDSDAISDQTRVLPQHQAALTFLGTRLSNPSLTALPWLDLACGQGQILALLDTIFTEQARGKIEYTGIDIEYAHTRETERSAARLKFRSVMTRVSELSDFNKLLDPGQTFGFITMTNTVHEISPVYLPSIFMDAIARLSDTGTLYVYDMDRLERLELGAVTWTRDEIRRLLHCLLDALGAPEYRPEVGSFPHRTCKGWNVLLERQHLELSHSELIAHRDAAIENMSKEIVLILKEKRRICRNALENLTVHGPETANEVEDRDRLLNEFWGLERSLERWS